MESLKSQRRHGSRRRLAFSIGLMALTAIRLGQTSYADLLQSHKRLQNQEPASSRNANEPLPLTVADSIEMTHITEPSENAKEAHPQFSPNGELFLVVAEKGNLETNLREYSLLVYNARELNKQPIPTVIFKSSSNRPGIFQAKWLTNEIISFIGENPGEVPQVYTVNCRTLKLRQLTSDQFGVAGYDATHDLKTVVYNAHWGGDPAQTQYKEAHGFVVSTEELADLSSGEWKHPRDAFQTYVLDTSSGLAIAVKGGPFAALDVRLQIWLSPDGNYAVTERPAFPVPATWESYDDRWVSETARSLRKSMTSRLQLHWLNQPMLINTRQAEIEPLVNAPLRTLMGAVWLDNHSVIVAGSYLPLEGSQGEEAAKRKALPIIAEFAIPSRSCEKIADIQPQEYWALEASGRPDAFVANIGGGTGPGRQLFHHEGKRWVTSSNQETIPKLPNITIKQSLDQWPRLVVIDPGTGKETLITDPNPQLEHRRLGRVELIHWTGKLGEPWIGGFVYPVGYQPGTRYPLVIQTHDFSPDLFLLDGPFTTAMAAQEMANKGIAVLQIGDSPFEDQTKSKPEEGEVMLSAYESAVDYLEQLGLVDRHRVGLIGFSRTAYHVKYALTHSHFHFAAATAAEGIDFGYWQYVSASASPNFTGQYEQMYGGEPWSGNWRPWIRDSITFNFDRVDTPLLLEANTNPHAIVDEWETFAALQLLKRPVELIFIPHGSHVLVKPWERLISQEENVDWFTFWLKDEEDVEPAKAEQYRRWRELRDLQQKKSGSHGLE